MSLECPYVEEVDINQADFEHLPTLLFVTENKKKAPTNQDDLNIPCAL